MVSRRKFQQQFSDRMPAVRKMAALSALRPEPIVKCLPRFEVEKEHITSGFFSEWVGKEGD